MTVMDRSIPVIAFFFFNDTATTEIYTLSLHDALPILLEPLRHCLIILSVCRRGRSFRDTPGKYGNIDRRSEEHTSELQSRQYLVCRLLLEKKTSNTHKPSAMPQHNNNNT